MKKIITKFVLVFAVAIFFASCSTVNKGMQSSPVISRNVQLDPLKADITVNDTKKLKGESNSSYFLFFRLNGDNKYSENIKYSAETDVTSKLFGFLNPFALFKRIATGDAVGKVKAAAAYKALENSDADVLVHPTYTITEKNYFIYYVFKAEVTGYSGKYNNFRTEKEKVIILEGGKEHNFTR